MIQRITLAADLTDIISRLTTYTGLSVNDIVNHLLVGHLPELHELDAFLEAHPAGAGSLHEQGANLLQSYGPESIMEGIARIAPHYKTLAASFLESFNEPVQAVRAT